ncbi:MAG: hypothetical protein AMXMBFR84_22890 [Candidatus Hydrogenedentota bacterium]
MDYSRRSGRISNFVIALLLFNVLLVAVIIGLLAGSGFLDRFLPGKGGEGTSVASSPPQQASPARDPAPESEPEKAPSDTRPAEPNVASRPMESHADTVGEAANSLITPPPPPEGANQSGADAATPVTAEGAVPMLADGSSPLTRIQPGMTYNAVVQLLGRQGTLDANTQGLAYHPIGWFRYRWSDSDGGVVLSLFTPDAFLMHVEASGIKNMEQLTDQPGFKIPKWLNDNFREANLPVRAVNAALAGQQTALVYQSQLVNEAGQFVGTVNGTLYVGDGATTVVPGDQRPYRYAMDGAYQFYMQNGVRDERSFALVEY